MTDHSISLISLALQIVTTFIVLLVTFLVFIWYKSLQVTTIQMPSHISDRVFRWCTSDASVSAELASDPKLTPGVAAERLFGHEPKTVAARVPHDDRKPASLEDLERARQCGKFGERRPSELFLRVFHDALCALETDPLVGCVSPSLMGSCGTIPLTVISPLLDICRHMSNLIARAESEVFLATNYWVNSDASRLISEALVELSKRAGSRGARVVVKILYDRGNVKQVMDNHQIIPASQYSTGKINLPAPDEVPNINMQVINYHRPVFGTFHSKFMVVDRKYAIVSSNNIQDNDNLEMMSHLEGPIVDSLYDVSVISWHKALEPPLPCLETPAASESPPASDPTIRQSLEEAERNFRNGTTMEVKPPIHAPGDPHFDKDIAAEVARMQSVLDPTAEVSRLEAVTDHLNLSLKQTRKGTAPESEDHWRLYIPYADPELFPIALVNRKPWGAPSHASGCTPQNEAWLSAVRNAKRSVFCQTPDLNADVLLPELIAAVRRGVEVTCYVTLGYNDAGELLPFQGGHNEMIANKLYMQLQPEERKRLHYGYYVGKDQTMPIHNKFKSRSSHIKLMIVDEQIAIQGNGNLDTQSWYHSQEVNILIDSEAVCKLWLDGIRRSQNTHIYGMASQEDGIWRDSDGNEAPGAIGKDPGRLSWAKGVVGAVQRVRGVGGF